MADFFSNLAFMMGGEDQITPEFRTMFADYPAYTPTEYAPVTPAAPAAPSAPVSPAAMPKQAEPIRGGMFGLSQLFGNTPTQTIGASTGSVTVGDAPAGGLYGGSVSFNPGDNALTSIDPYAYASDKKQGASRLAADVQRAQYQDYLNRFAPVENFAINQLRGRQTADVGYDVARANQSVLNSGMNMQGQQERAMGRYGLEYKGPSMVGSNEVTGGRVAAMNQARLNDERRALNLMAGGTGNGGTPK